MDASVAPISQATLQELPFAELIDYYAEHNPDHSFNVFPGTADGDALSRISFLEFGRAAQRFARAIYPDAPVKEREVVGLLVNADSIMWTAALAGLIRAGVTVFPISPRNSPAAICHVLRTVSAHRLIVTESSFRSLLDDVKAELASSDYSLQIQELPTMDAIYPHLAQETTKHEFEAIALPPRSDNPDEVVMYIHSSGSTGFPKSIPLKQEIFSKFIFDPMFGALRDRKEPFSLGCPGLPDFHVLGIWMHFFYPFYTGRPVGVFRPTAPRPPPVASPTTIMAALKVLKPTMTMVIPSLLEAWIHDKDAVACLKAMGSVHYGGGPLSTAVGDALVAQGVHLRTGYGSTECGVVTAFESSQITNEEWAWAELAATVTVRWKPQGDGTSELQVLRGEKHVVHVENLPDVRGYATQDLWMPHPTKEGLWRIVGRVDDVLILANGEKVVPAPIEGKILAHPFVHGVLAFGRERNQVGVLVEPTEEHAVDPADERALAAFRNAIWPAVEEANRVSPAFGRVHKEMILVTSPNKLLPRAAKGTVTRKAALALYEAEINALYEAVERPDKGSDVEPPASWGLDDVTAWLSSLAGSIRDGKELKKDVDIFEQGFDSLSSTFLRNHIVGALRSSLESEAATKIDNGFVYAHPTISEMASAIASSINSKGGAAVNDPTDAIHAMIEEYSRDLPKVAPLDTPRPEDQVVLITGSTRGLGSELLSSFILNDKVKKVYALNRPSGENTSLARHQETFDDRNLDQEVLSSPKLVLLEAETAKEHLGLPDDLYEELRNSVTTVIHNAWRLDFNLALSSFESAIRGTRNLLDLAMTNPHAAHIRMFFTSSIAVTRSWPRAQGAFPEEPQADAKWCVGGGYGESKYVCEQLLARAAERGLHTTSLRIGQICGSQGAGTWAVTDWVPIMISSSVALGCLPEAKGVMSWITPEAVNGMILDVALGADTPERALNVVHPRPIEWSSMMGNAADELVRHGITKDRLPLVEMSEWFAKLSEVSDGADEARLKQIPAIKLLAFFGGQAKADAAARANGAADCEAGGLTTLATTKAQHASRTMRELEPLGSEDVGRWIGYWKGKGLFHGST